MSKNRILIVNHIFWPDNINTARHITELADELSYRSWNVSVLVGNRDYRSNEIIGSNFEKRAEVKISRVFIPKFSNKKNAGRLLTSLWLIFSFAFKLPFLGKFDAIVLGSNPPFSFFLAPYLKLINRNTKLFLWSFDLYPDAIYASKNANSIFFGKLLNKITVFCYKNLDVLVDIGPCMKYRLKKYVANNITTETLTPWSFVEQTVKDEIHIPTRNMLFGEANLTLMYTGTIGHAHEFDNFLALARILQKKNASIAFCFAGFGKKINELKSLCNSNDINISFAEFVNSDKELNERLSSADIMMVSLKDNWSGISVPSKFFTSIGTGKPVLYSGAKDSAIESWIREYNLGFHLTKDNIDLVSIKLIDISNNSHLINDMKSNCLESYKNTFSKKYICDKWSTLIWNTIHIDKSIL
ncbi:MAG: glycosyltransferase family 4 protein [Lutibacter sp.]|nr:glycosyltransferase family 4 protein [Lutibacter sp.]